MAKRPRKTTTKKPFTPPPPAPGSEFSFAEYEDGAPFESSEEFEYPGLTEYDVYELASHGRGDLLPPGLDLRDVPSDEFVFARRCGTLERAVFEDPFATADLEAFGPYYNDPQVTPEPQAIALARFEIAAKAYCNAVQDNSGDLDKRKILADIVAYWLRESRRCNELGIEVW
jgi:hypothetical protein